LPLSAGPATKAIYGLITLATLLRILTPLAGDLIELALWLADAQATASPHQMP